MIVVLASSTASAALFDSGFPSSLQLGPEYDGREKDRWSQARGPMRKTTMKKKVMTMKEVAVWASLSLSEVGVSVLPSPLLLLSAASSSCCCCC